MTPEPKAPVILLHGAWHGAWCWEPITRLLAAAGHPILAVDLIGGGLRAVAPEAFRTGDPEAMATEPSPLGEISAADYAADAAESLTAFTDAHGPAVVVGHSLSGVVLHHLGESAPDRIRRLVYLAALAPAPGSTVFADAAGPAFAESLFLALPAADPAVTGVVRINWNSPDPDYLDTARRCFYDDVPDALAATATRMLTSDVPVRLYSDEIALSDTGWGSIPRTWIRCTRDRAVPVAAQDTNIRALDAAFPDHPFDTVTLDSGHSPFLSDPQGLGDALVSIAGTG